MALQGLENRLGNKSRKLGLYEAVWGSGSKVGERGIFGAG